MHAYSEYSLGKLYHQSWHSVIINRRRRRLLAPDSQLQYLYPIEAPSSVLPQALFLSTTLSTPFAQYSLVQASFVVFIGCPCTDCRKRMRTLSIEYGSRASIYT